MEILLQRRGKATFELYQQRSLVAQACSQSSLLWGGKNKIYSLSFCSHPRQCSSAIRYHMEQPLWPTETEEHTGSQVLNPVSLAISNICKCYSCEHIPLQEPWLDSLDMLSSLCSDFQTLSKLTPVRWLHPHTPPVPLRLFCCFQTFTPVVSLKYTALMYSLLFTGFLHCWYQW